MNSDFTALDNAYGSSRGTFWSYAIGFALSVILTFIPYAIVTKHALPERISLIVVVGLALLQLVVQLLFFLHLSTKSHARWNIAALIFTVMIVAIITGGSLWIMNSLNANMMPSPTEMDQYMLEQENMHR